jgi:hypothetical protein
VTLALINEGLDGGIVVATVRETPRTSVVMIDAPFVQGKIKPLLDKLGNLRVVAFGGCCFSLTVWQPVIDHPRFLLLRSIDLYFQPAYNSLVRQIPQERWAPSTPWLDLCNRILADPTAPIPVQGTGLLADGSVALKQLPGGLLFPGLANAAQVEVWASCAPLAIGSSKLIHCGRGVGGFPVDERGETPGLGAGGDAGEIDWFEELMKEPVQPRAFVKATVGRLLSALEQKRALGRQECMTLMEMLYLPRTMVAAAAEVRLDPVPAEMWGLLGSRNPCGRGYDWLPSILRLIVKRSGITDAFGAELLRELLSSPG